MSNFELDPLGDKVIVKPIDETKGETKTPGGIIITFREDVNKELPCFAEVVAVGHGGTFPGCPDPSQFVSVGDTVAFNRYAGLEFTIGDELNPKEMILYKSLNLDAIIGISTKKDSK